MKIAMNPIDLGWAALDAIVWDLMEVRMAEAEAGRVRKYALEVAKVVARFYGGDLEWVREESMRRYEREKAHPTKIPNQRGSKPA